MYSLLSLIAFSLSLIQYHAQPVDARPRSSGKLLPRQTANEPCYDVFNSGYDLFPARFVYDCLVTAPFNATVALQFLSYYNDTLQFQSTLAYLKNPPPSYQQPAIDVIDRLNKISQRVQAGEFKNEYTFEAAVQEVVSAVHDDHVILDAGILSAFTFGSPLRIVSVSKDGIELPKIYIPDDLIEAYGDEEVDWTPSAVSTINGEVVDVFLTQFAAINSFGNVEPNTDWNDLMSSPAADVQGIFSFFEGNTIFYPGENITFKFENGSSTYDLPWLAWYSLSIADDPPTLSSGQELYDYFVRGIAPVSDTMAAAATSTPAAAATSTSEAGSTSSTAEDTAATTIESAEATPSSWEYFPYPNNPIASQPNLGFLNGGVITGYFLNDGVTAVLSIPSFDMTANAVSTFSSTIAEVLEKSKADGRTRFIIDLQKNDGGSDLLAADAFKQFFPTIDPLNGNRLRAHPLADALGNTYTNYYTTQPLEPDLYSELSAEVWTAPVYLNAATGRNFTGWPEFFGPHPDNGDFFTTPQRSNLSSIIYDLASTGDGDNSDGIVVYGFANRTTTMPPPYAAEQLVLLTDGFCSSACATFVELMHHQAGVRTVVVGGRPERGPMQAVGGSRGGEAYTSIALDQDMEVATILNESIAVVLPDRITGNYVNYAGINIRDSIRPNENFPLQFAYEAATCRIFYTRKTVYNYLNLWNYVVDAVWRNPSLCIDGSANGTTILPTDKTGPLKNSKAITEANNDNIANLILTGLSSGPQNNPIEKRATPTTSSLAPSSPNYFHIFDRDLINAGACSVCSTRQGLTCAPACIQGRVQQGNTCVRTCQQGGITCRYDEVCVFPGGGGVCLNARQSSQLSNCRAPTRPAQAQSTRAIGGGNQNVPYGVQRSRGGRSRS